MSASAHTALTDILKAAAALSSAGLTIEADEAAEFAMRIAQLDSKYWHSDPKAHLENACLATAYLLDREGRITHVEAARAMAVSLPDRLKVSCD